MPTPDRRPRGQHRRARQGRRAPAEGSLLQRIQIMMKDWRQARQERAAGAAKPSASRSSANARGNWLDKSPLPRRHTLGLLILLPLWLILLAWQPSDELPATAAAPSGSLEVPLAMPVQAARTSDGQPQKPVKPVEQLPAGWQWLDHEIGGGETLFAVFRKYQLPGAELSRLVAIEGPDRPLTRLQSGKTVNILLDNNRRIQRVEIRSHDEPIYRYVRENEGFAQKEIPAS
ncbi:LysM-like peptidoglycan-binding domain-containing protein [Aeromonas simiae]|uniref:LysM-like peptidoglycan-binding domain-containing protein n=1 Tax=Aeromonas simiae TaxID=218936 RepID=UPI0005A79B49|nr:LysM-like peptidoglycan-binding domain-containing protein [Aeromonas simiae]MDO2949229.1 opacity-associated protein A [Aeromonas simiae]MDO2951211.1 opacity-associated protein A [Aeromonas simiae]MDO2956447.1 opacity-associated protein A [Aeromonas simiae]